MAPHTNQCPSPTVENASPDAVGPEFKHPAIDLNDPALEDPMDNRDPNSSVSNCKRVVSADQSGNPPSPFIGSRLVGLSEGDKVSCLIKENFISRLAWLGVQVTSVAIHQKSDISAKAQAQEFLVYLQAVQKKGGDNTTDVEYAWCATSKEEAPKILSDGFGYSGKPENNSLRDCGVYFSPYGHPLESVTSAPIDEDGLRHMLVCRVKLGKSDVVSPGSEQSHPSSEEYDSGVNNLSFPKRYIIWSTHTDSRVVPMYIVSFRATCCLTGILSTPEKLKSLTTPSIPFSIFILELSKMLPPSHFNLISKYHKDHKERKISKHELIHKIRHIAGERLLIGFIESLRNKERKIPAKELILKFRQLAGDRLLIEIIKSFRTEVGKIPKHEVIEKFRQIGGDRLLIGLIRNLRTKMSSYHTAKRGKGTQNVEEEEEEEEEEAHPEP